MTQLIEKDILAIVLDISGSFSVEHLEPPLLKELNRNIHNWDVYTEGMPIDIFSPMQINQDTIKHISETSNRLTDIIGKALKIGSMQKNTLYEGIMDVLNAEAITDSSNPYYDKISWLETGSPRRDLKLLQYYISHQNIKNCESVLLKLVRMADSNLFRGFSDTLTFNLGAAIFSIQNFSEDIKGMIADMFLWQLWNMKVKGNSVDEPLYIFVDEFQNMNFHTNSPLYKILCEGRKYRFNLILGTRFVKGRYDKMQLSALDKWEQKYTFIQMMMNYLQLQKSLTLLHLKYGFLYWKSCKKEMP